MKGTNRGVSCTRRRYCLLVLGFVLTVLCVLYYYVGIHSTTHNARRWQPVLVGSKYRFPTAPPYTEFIDPQLDNFKRKFYSGLLVEPPQQRQKPSERAASPPTVTIFSLKPGEEEEVLRYVSACVPFYGPNPNGTGIKICVYDREVDQMISSYIRDYGVWEKEQVADMVSLLRADDAEQRRRKVMLQRSHDPAAKSPAEKEAEAHPLASRLRLNADENVNGKAMGRRGDDTIIQSAVEKNRGSAFQGARAGSEELNTNSQRGKGEDHDTVRKEAEDLSFGAEPREDKRERGNPQQAGSDAVAQQAAGGLTHVDVETARLLSPISVVDIGCNVGVYALSAASLGHPVLAVDPVRSSLRLLATSLRLNHLHSSSSSSSSSSPSSVTLLLNAVSNRRGQVAVNVNSGNIGGSVVSERRRKSFNNEPDSRDTVWAVCLNDLVPHVPTHRVFLKLDIEGWEERALRCAGDFFQRLDVRYVLMEWLFYRKSSGGPAVIGFMVRNGLLPYADASQSAVLNPAVYYSWPDNVLWVKR